MSDELKERPMDFETERPSQSEIDAAVAEITARLKTADAKEDRIALLEADADRYIWLMAHMGRMDSVAKTWVPGKHKPLLVYLQDYNLKIL